MDATQCSDHKEQPAVAYCPLEKVPFCTKCLEKHEDHNTISIDTYINNITAQASIIKETSSLLTSTGLIIQGVFGNAEAMLSQQSTLIAKSLVNGTQLN